MIFGMYFTVMGDGGGIGKDIKAFMPITHHISRIFEGDLDIVATVRNDLYVYVCM